MKLYHTDRFETKLSQTEIKERLRDIALEDRLFNICIKDKKIYQIKFKNNMVSFFYLSHVGVQDLLAPRMHVEVFEEEKGCICDLYHSSTYGIIFTFAWWSAFWGICVFVSLVRNDFFMSVCYIAIYMLGVWTEQRHRIGISKRVASFLKDYLKATKIIRK